ncbi:S-formylglutathione hydrolase [Microtus ochrogaster]|uniref:S-formylglutathione hydrolase n=1 Tax=Microtus ochrogaster TaxID=79684 RepID=A0A8J6GWX2_MICOH|nr:S-formylglutathione hydrolase [Microtus ochrogaster]
MALSQISSNRCFGGLQKVFEHDSVELKCKMRLAVYLPPRAESAKCPALYWLSGLTCTEQNFITKSGFQQAASEHGLVVIAPDTSPRGCNIKGEDDSWDFGTGAGFYVNATEDPWKTNYRMYSYVTEEVIQLSCLTCTEQNFITKSGFQQAASEHGLVVIAPDTSPRGCNIKGEDDSWDFGTGAGFYVNATEDPWKTNYRMYSYVTEEAYDATCLVKSSSGSQIDILIDQGKDDEFLTNRQLLPDNFIAACTEKKIPVVYRLQEASIGKPLTMSYFVFQGYDHSYYFIATFITDHIRHHAKYLNA